MTVELRVLSYNLLAPLFVRVPGQSYSDFGHAAAEHLDWTRREPMIAARIADAGADLVHLQEVQFEPGDEAAGALPWVPPRWLTRLAEAHRYRVLPVPLTANQWRSQQRRNERATGRTACVGLVTLLGPRATEPTEPLAGSKSLLVGFEIAGEPFVGINVHLEGHPDKDAERAKQLKSAVRKAIRLGPHRHLVVAGDFNADPVPDSGLGRALLGLHGAHRPATGPTWSGGGPGRAVDHGVFGPSLSVLEARVAAAPEDLAGGMPNAEQPSDHAPLHFRVRVTGPAPAIEEPAPSPRADGPEPSAARKVELEAAWRNLQERAPAPPRGPPDPETREALKADKLRKKAFLDQLPSEAERRFVRSLPPSAS